MSQTIPHPGFNKWEFFKSLDYRADGPPLAYDPANPDMVNYPNHKAGNPAQAAFHKAAEEGKRFLSMFGGSGLGKSLAAAREAEVTALCPHKTIWLVGEKYNLAEKEYKYMWEDLIVTCKLNPTHKTYDVRGGNMGMFFPWDTKIECRSEQVPSTLLGEGVDVLVLCEGAKLAHRTYQRYLERAVARRNGIVICNTTPSGLNWVYDTFYIPAQRGDPLFWSGIYDVLNNPFYPRSEYERLKRTLPADIFQEQVEGRFVRYSGLVFSMFDRKVHCGKYAKKWWDREWPMWVAIDLNSGRGHAVLFMVITPENQRLFVAEIWRKCELEELSEMIRTKCKQLGKFPDKVIWDGPEIDNSPDGVHLRRLMADAKIRGRKARRLPKGAQFLDMQKVLKDDVLGSSGLAEPLVLIDPEECPHFIWELEHLEWHEKKTERFETLMPGEKNDDHIDDWRYLEAEHPHFDVMPLEEVAALPDRVDYGRPAYGKRSGY